MKALPGIAGLTMATLLLAFLQQLLVTTVVGPGSETDAYFAAIAVPQLITILAGGTLANVLLPMLSTQDGAARRTLAWTSVQVVGVLVGLLSLLLAVLAPYWLALLVPGLSGSARELAIDLTRVQLLFAVVMSVSALQGAVHRANGSFLWPEASAAIGGLAGLALLAGTVRAHGVTAASWSLVIRSAVASVLMLPGMGLYELPRLRAPSIRTFGRRSLTIFSATTVTKSDLLVDRFFASLAPPGSMTLLNLAQTLYSSVQMILNRSLVLPIVPRLSQLAAGGHQTDFGRLIFRSIAVMAVITGAGLLGIWMIGAPLLHWVFERGSFAARDVEQLRNLLLLLGGVLVAGAAGQVLSSAYYASGAIAAVARVAIASFAVGVLLKLIAFARFGIEGLAAAASLYYILSFGLLAAGMAVGLVHAKRPATVDAS